MRRLQLIAIFLFISGLFFNNLAAQSISVFTTAIDAQVNGERLDEQNYSLLEDGVANYDNGEWVGVKIEIGSEQATKDHFIHLSYSLLDTVEVWTPGDNGRLYMLYQTGQAFKFNTRPYNSSDFVFPLLERNQEYYLRIYSSKPIVVPFEVISIQPLFEKLTKGDFLFGIFVGLIGVMFLYNLVLLFITRDNSYGYYILYLLTLVLTQSALFGYTDRFIMPNWPILNQNFTVLSGALVGITSMAFIINFLRIRVQKPLFFRLFIIVFVLDGLGILFLLIGLDVPAFYVVNLASFYGSIVGFIAAFKLAKSGFKPAKFFLIAWSIFLVSVIIFALMNVDIIPYDPLLYRSMLFGSSIEAILLSVALADRITVLRKESRESQQRALEMAQENERIIKEQNIKLEEKVQLRTKELRGANKELNVTLENLKAAQTNLVQSEKMASLGILTAGVAHEINNPLNFIYGGHTAILDELNKKEDLNLGNLKEYLEWIEMGAEKATEIVKSLNVYSRTNDDLTETCNINKIVNACLSMLQNKIKANTKIDRNLDKNIGIIKGNNGKLHQVVLNLLGNALDAIEENGHIQIESRSNENEILLTIEDNGSGISKQNLKKVLDPFFTTKAPGKGTGLGLSIVHSIIQEHTGSIEFDSEEGRGTKVSLRLPKA